MTEDNSVVARIRLSLTSSGEMVSELHTADAVFVGKGGGVAAALNSLGADIAASEGPGGCLHDAVEGFVPELYELSSGAQRVAEWQVREHHAGGWKATSLTGGSRLGGLLASKNSLSALCEGLAAEYGGRQFTYRPVAAPPPVQRATTALAEGRHR